MTWIGTIKDEHTMQKLGFYDGEVTTYVCEGSEDMDEFIAEFSPEEIEEFSKEYPENDDEREIAEIFAGQNEDFHREEHVVWCAYRPVYDVPDMKIRVEIWDDGYVDIAISAFNPEIAIESLEYSYDEIAQNQELRELIDLSLEIFVDYGVLRQE